jgi:two-component system invasion response regulator UvrY
MKNTTILIVEDHQLLRQTWSCILNNYVGYQVIGECENAQDAIGLARSVLPEIIILDINLPGMNGIEAVPHLLKSSPTSKILGISMHGQPAYARKMIKQGAMGYVCKKSSSQEMLVALTEIRKGNKYLCQEIKDQLSMQMISSEGPDNLQQLSTRELEVIQLLKNGSSSKEIAQSLCIAVKTVEVHRYNILKKLGLRNTAALVNFVNVHNVGEKE